MEVVQGPGQDPVKPQEEKPRGFKFSYEAFENVGLFVQAVQKVYACRNYPNFKSAHRIKRLGDALQKELNTYQEFRKDIDKIEDPKEREEKIKDLHSTKVDIKWDRLTEQEINCIQGISPQDVMALEFIADPSLFQ